jgi:hypothetical protein
VERTDEGTIRVTLGHPGGVVRLEGSPAEVRALAAAMDETALLARASDSECSWLADVAVGEHRVRLGITPGGRVRLRVLPD